MQFQWGVVKPQENRKRQVAGSGRYGKSRRHNNKPRIQQKNSFQLFIHVFTKCFLLMSFTRCFNDFPGFPTLEAQNHGKLKLLEPP